MKGKTIAILGWAYKANTNDSRESASIYITEILYNTGAMIEIYDPMVSEAKIIDDISSYWSNKDLSKIKISKIFQANSKYDAIIILTDWDEFNLKLRNHKSKVFDGRLLLNKNDTFYTIGY